MAIITGFTGFELYNKLGRVDLHAPFQLFGGAPLIGDYYELRSPDVFNQLTRSAVLRLEWQNLPGGDLSRFIIALSSGSQSPLFSKAIRIDPCPVDGILRVTLVEPPDAFGHQTYAYRAVEAALHQKPMPAPPYSPMVKRIWLDYESVG